MNFYRIRADTLYNVLLCDVSISCCKQFDNKCIAKVNSGMLIMLNVINSICIFRMYIFY